MGDHGTFQRGGLTRHASTPAQAVKLKHDGWRKVDPDEDAVAVVDVPIFASTPTVPGMDPVEIGTAHVPIHATDINDDDDNMEDGK